MKISVFGKSGPRLVTTGFVTAVLVCANAAEGPAAIQPAVSRANNPKNILGISVLPDRSWFALTYHDTGLVAPIDRHKSRRARSRDFKPAQQMDIFWHR